VIVIGNFPARVTFFAREFNSSHEPGMAKDLTRIVILGADGRDFHDFNMLYREDLQRRAARACHPHRFTGAGNVVFAGVDYATVLSGAEYAIGTRTPIALTIAKKPRKA
jgi:hypothetical protein